MPVIGWGRKSDDVIALHKAVSQSFQLVRSDMHTLTDTHQNQARWITYLHQKLQEQDQYIRQMTNHLRSSSSIQQGQHERTAQLMSRIELLSAQVAELAQKHRPVSEQLYEHGQKIQRLEESAAPLRSRLDEHQRKLDELHGPLHRRLDEHQDLLRQLRQRHEPLISGLQEHHERIARLEQKPVPEPRRQVQQQVAQRLARTSKDYIRQHILSLVAKYERLTGVQLREMIVEEQRLCSRSSFYRILDSIEETEQLHVVAAGKDKQYVHKMAARGR